MTIQYATDEEQRLHSSIIYSLADQYKLDEEMIRDIYENKLESLMDGARVKTYLPVLVTRYVKTILSKARTREGKQSLIN
jgi:Protein of unknown function (DUF3562)